jgi:DNA-directed RNA polymerase subunit beta'
MITEGERYLKIIDAWTHCRERIGEDMLRELREAKRDGKPYVNPIFCMVMSKARGSVEQIRQLAGMRGLMAKPSGKIIEVPIRANFREGPARARVLLVDARRPQGPRRHGAQDGRLGLPDAQARGRRAERRDHDARLRTPDGVVKGTVYQGDKIAVSFVDAVRGRTSRQRIVDHITDNVHRRRGPADHGRARQEARRPRLRADPGPLAADLRGVARRLRALLRHGPVAQARSPSLAWPRASSQRSRSASPERSSRCARSISVARRPRRSRSPRSRSSAAAGSSSRTCTSSDRADGERVVLKRRGEIILVDAKDREIERYSIPLGAVLRVKENQEITERTVLCSWDPHHHPILAEVGGIVKLEDVLEGKTYKAERDPRARSSAR